MAWVNFTTPEAIGDAYDTYGTVKLQYDNSSVGSTRSCRLYFELDQGKTVYIYFRNVDIDGSEVQSQVLVNGSMTIWSGTLSANASHSYYFCCPWYTGTTCYGSSGTLPSGYVAPTTPTISATVSGTTATITYGTTSFGTPSTGTVTLYGGTATAPTTSIDTTNTTGNKTFSHTGLTPGTTYYYRARANNGQLDSNYSTEVSIAVPTPTTAKLYGSVNSQAEQVQKLYGSVNQLSKEILKLYGANHELVSLNLDTSATYTLVTNVDEATFIDKYNSWISDAGDGIFYKNEITQINVRHVVTTNDNYYDFYFTGKMPSHPQINKTYSVSISGNMNTVLSVAQQWGITFTSSSTAANDILAATPAFSTLTKLIYQA